MTPDPRIQAWGGGLSSRINAKPPETVTDYRDYIRARKVPVISHEIGQWCVYPNLAEIAKYTGYLKAEELRDLPRDARRPTTWAIRREQFLLASGKLQTLCYKEDIESALRTPGMGGFQLLDLHDFPGQGTALVGVLDPFWESKGYVTAAEYSRFCNSTVPLARLQEAGLYVRRNARRPTRSGALRPRAAGRRRGRVATGRQRRPPGRAAAGCPPATCPIDNGIALGHDHACRWQVWRRRPSTRSSCGWKGRRSKTTGTCGSTRRRSTWQLPAGVTVVNELNDPAIAALRDGGKVLLLIPPRRGEGRPAGQGRARVLQHLLEHGVDPPPAAPHAGNPLRPRAPGAGRVPHRVPQQLAVVVPRQPGPTHDPRSPAARAPATGPGDRRLVHQSPARPGVRGQGRRREALGVQHRLAERSGRQSCRAGRCSTAWPSTWPGSVSSRPSTSRRSRSEI